MKNKRWLRTGAAVAAVPLLLTGLAASPASADEVHFRHCLTITHGTIASLSISGVPAGQRPVVLHKGTHPTITVKWNSHRDVTTLRTEDEIDVLGTPIPLTAFDPKTTPEPITAGGRYTSSYDLIIPESAPTVLGDLQLAMIDQRDSDANCARVGVSVEP